LDIVSRSLPVERSDESGFDDRASDELDWLPFPIGSDFPD
jgi:hypothetical protein